MLSPGVLLDGRYCLDEFVASGGMGGVWRATDTVLGRVVAVKVLLPAMHADPGFAARFRAEARILAALRHPNVVDVYDYGETSTPSGEAMYLVMAYVDGESLYHRLSTGPLPVATTLAVVAQAADALEAAHAGGIVHRDVKPGNLLIRPDGTVVLVDFGVARSTNVTAITTGNVVPGTALYMAPEQATGQPVTASVDVYALGAVTYHCLTGQPPFTGDTPVEVAIRHLQDEPPPLPPEIPPPVVGLVTKAMAKDPGERIPSAAAFAASARAIASGAVPPEDVPVGAAGVGAAGVGAAGVGAAGVDSANNTVVTSPVAAAAIGSQAIGSQAPGGPAPGSPATGPAAGSPAPGGPASGGPASGGPATALESPGGPVPPREGDHSFRRRAALIGAAVILGFVAIVGLLALNPDGTPAPADEPGPSLTPAVVGSTRPGTRNPNRPASSSAPASVPASAATPTPSPEVTTGAPEPEPSSAPPVEPPPTPTETQPAASTSGPPTSG